jgi:hypothetical protein
MRWFELERDGGRMARRPMAQQRPAREAWLLLVSIALAALLIGVAGAARGQVALLPQTQEVVIASGDAETDELAAVALDGGFAVIWNRGAVPPEQGETLRVQRLGLDAGPVGAPVLHTVNVLTALDAVAIEDGLTFGYLTTQPFATPSIVLRRHQGQALDATGNATFTDADVAPFRLTSVGEDAAAALYQATATIFEIGTPGSGVKVTLPLVEDSAGLAGMAAGGGDLFVFTPDPVGGVEPAELVRYRLGDGMVEDGPDDVVTDSFASGTPLWITPAGARHLLAWRRPDSSGAARHAAVFLTASGAADGSPFALSLSGREDAELSALAVDAQGLVWTLWRDGGDLLVAAFGPGENTATPLTVTSGALVDHALAVTSAGSALVTWIDGSDRVVRGQVFGECASGGAGGVLCLQRGRFLVELEFETAEGEVGEGNPVPTRSVESGLFWFFTPDNWEFLVKVLPACPINGFYWVFAAPTTDIGFTLRVLDTETLQQRTYVNPVGTLPTVINDTSAFACSAP